MTVRYALTTDGTYKRRSVYGKSWHEAHEKLTKLKADSLNGLPVATSEMTIVEYLAYWLTNVAKGKVRKTTYVNYESLVRNYVPRSSARRSWSGSPLATSAPSSRRRRSPASAARRARTRSGRSTSGAAAPSGSAARSSRPTGPCASSW
ncbi:hypothetical protein ACFYT4_32905 [Streptomyces sp. NPDC004609]|uniref:hypothetical protein n=1 Tax=Streptomyces sp. NPDC004609 TaxID=3364704 RepID=UPI00369F6C73